MEDPGAVKMDGYFGRPMTDAEYARMGGASLGGHMMAVSGVDTISGAMMGGETLDDIVMQNQKEMERRRGMHPQYMRQAGRQEGAMRRNPLMEFGSGANGDLDDFQFHSPVLTGHGAMLQNAMSRSAADVQAEGSRRNPPGHLTLNTHFGSVDGGYSALSHASPFHSGMPAVTPLDLDPNSAFDATGLSAHVAQSMSMGFPSAPLDTSPRADSRLLNQLGQPGVQHGLPNAPYPSAQAGFHGPMPSTQDPGGGGAQDTGPFNGHADGGAMEDVTNIPASERVRELRDDLGEADLFSQEQALAVKPRAGQSLDQAPKAPAGSSQGRKPGDDGPPSANPLGGDGARQNGNTVTQQEPTSLFRGIYSSSGFDMLKILMRVAARPNPEINIGAVDMSCAFVVCDISQHDTPIVYCSEVFERLTGYTRHEILGRNCRFLQAPDGKVQSGVERKYVDDDNVYHLKQKVMQRREAQVSLINYRKGGQPFMNLLTMIPITWDTDEFRFFVGFQVDLVETPQSVTNKNSDGTYSINYQRGFLPRYVWNTPETNRNQAESGQTIPRDDVSTVLTTIGTGESELSKRIWDKVLLENTDDVVHVLSLKGLFLYLSPSSRKVLEYDSSELVGTALSSICHPSDIVPVTRELRDTGTGASVNVVFRIRRKHSGYTWFESHGSLHTEQGKGRKCIILVGRERPVYALSKSDIVVGGGIGDSELWTKMSTSGMFLFVSSNVKALLDRQPDEMVGTSIQWLMRKESKIEFGKQLELARTGKRAQLKHEIQNRRGQVLQAHTTLYPGDAAEGQKPTFLVAQTRLLKLSRSMLGMNNPPKTSTSSGSTNTTATAQSGTPSQQNARGVNADQSPKATQITDFITTHPGGSGLPIGTQDDALASDENVFEELKTTRSTSWQFELRQMEKRNRVLAEELQSLLSARKKRKRRRGAGQLQKDCANCHTRNTPEWRRGPSGNRDLCNSCGLRWAKQVGRVSPRTGSQHSDKQSASPTHSSPPVIEGLPGQQTTMGPPELRLNEDINTRPRQDSTMSQGPDPSSRPQLPAKAEDETGPS